MPRYTFTGAYETVLEGLVHGVNAVLHRRDDDGEDVDHGQPDESTVMVRPGDQVVTDQPYPHADLVNVETEKPDEQVNAERALDLLQSAADRAKLPTSPDQSGQVLTATGSGEQKTAVEHTADGTMSPPVSNEPPASAGQTTDTAEGQE